MVATPEFEGRTYDDSDSLTGNDRTLGLVDFSLCPHLEREDMPDTSPASGALRQFLAIERTRPLYGRVADHNAASATMLARAGFVEVGTEKSFARGVGAEVVERIYRLDH